MHIKTGVPYPLGATVVHNGVNFSVYSRGSTKVELLLFDGEDSPEPAHVITLEPGRHRTYHYWHVFVPGLAGGQVYGYRVHGPHEPEKGLRFQPDKLLLDPYGRAVVMPENYDRGAACRQGDNCSTALRNVVIDTSLYDWEDDEPPSIPYANTVIYEMHVGGFTRHPSSGLAPELRGTYAGLIEKIPYLKELGVTAVELLPVFQFDPYDCPGDRTNYWGYSPIGFFSPHGPFSSRKDALGCLDEFRDMVKALHNAGLEVILDVVFNHTAEGNQDGPTLSFRGLSNADYYILSGDKRYYANYTGTGNTLNANHPVVRRLIVDSLLYWVEEMHVDGFRFDLASILSRDETGTPLANPPVLWDIETEPGLAGVKLIAEAWDPGGLYQVGGFVGDSWTEWNGRFRDDVRRFVSGEAGMVSALANRILASPDIYEHEGREATQSINFVTCHDGFTLNDLVSYNEKHNDANGENNQDGANDNYSWNCGVEGPTDDADIEALRLRQIKNYFVLTLFSLGTPMILMGDEVRHTQQGNNNAYSQDNELSWFDWSLVEENAGLLRFVKRLIWRRTNRRPDPEVDELPLNEFLQTFRIVWHGLELDKPDWSPGSRTLALTIQNDEGKNQLHMMINGYWEPLAFELPEGSRPWVRTVDTSSDAPDDIRIGKKAQVVESGSYTVQGRSIVVLHLQGQGAKPVAI